VKKTLFVAMIPAIAFASVKQPAFEGDLNMQIQVREDIHSKEMIPFDTYLRMDVKDLEGTDLHFYAKLWKDLGVGTEWNADWYDLSVSFNSANNVLITLGRQFLMGAVRATTADAIRVSAKFGDFKGTVYFGKPRVFEELARTGDDAIAGFKIEAGNYFFGFEHFREDGKVRDSSFVAGLNKKVFNGALGYGRLELDTAHGELSEALAGIQLVEKKYGAWVETSFEDKSYTYKGRERDPIFSAFTSGRVLRLSQGFNYDIGNNWKILESASVSDLQRDNNDNAYNVSLGVVKDEWTDKGWKFNLSFFYSDSWLGTLRGITAGFDLALIKNLFLNGRFDVARYRKVTYGSQWANNFYVSGKYWFGKFSNFELGLDYVENEDFDHEFRFLLRLNYIFWGEGKWKNLRFLLFLFFPVVLIRRFRSKKTFLQLQGFPTEPTKSS